jgi:hypothetical protein
MYERKLDLMDESVFPRNSSFAQKKNPKTSITTPVRAKSQENKTIVDYVTNTMKDTLGNKSGT